MLFSSFSFLCLFLPILLVIYFICYKLFKKTKILNCILCLFSLIFYAWGEPIYIILMITSIILNYIFAIKIEKSSKHKKLLLVLSIILNLLAITYFKYANFLITNINDILGLSINTLKLSLPIGISFYTFQLLSYVIDVYRGDVKAQKNIISLATYVSLFPQLIAGPIVRYETVEKELKDRKITLESFSDGIRRFIIGFGKKVIIANRVAILCDSVLSTNILELNSSILWLAIIGYTLQIYFDFSGYSDMAIGLGKMFGFTFLENFNYPYIATSVTDFWRRWHISLSTWFKDYLYIPLGGNRVSKIKWIRKLLIVWCLTGLWHGASWNFIIWGLYYGILLILEKLVLNKILDKTPKIIKYIYTILIIMIGWTIFRVENFNELFSILKGMFSFNFNGTLTYIYTHYKILSNIPYIVIGIILSTPIIKVLYDKFKNKFIFSLIYDFSLAVVFIISICFLLSSSYNPFIYFRF